MTKTEATKLSKKIDKVDGISVTGIHAYPKVYGRGYFYVIQVVDHLGGYPFQIVNQESWDRKMKAREFHAQLREKGL